MTEDNALKRALIPVLKALTRAINAYSAWAVKHRRVSNIIVGAVVLELGFIAFFSMIAFALTPLGLGIILAVLFVVLALAIGDAISDKQ